MAGARAGQRRSLQRAFLSPGRARDQARRGAGVDRACPGTSARESQLPRHTWLGSVQARRIGRGGEGAAKSHRTGGQDTDASDRARALKKSSGEERKGNEMRNLRAHCLVPRNSIPKGLRPPAQGCPERFRGYPGSSLKNENNPNGVVSAITRTTDERGLATTPLGLRSLAVLFPWVARSSQPRASRQNPVGIPTTVRQIPRDGSRPHFNGLTWQTVDDTTFGETLAGSGGLPTATAADFAGNVYVVGVSYNNNGGVNSWIARKGTPDPSNNMAWQTVDSFNVNGAAHPQGVFCHPSMTSYRKARVVW